MEINYSELSLCCTNLRIGTGLEPKKLVVISSLYFAYLQIIKTTVFQKLFSVNFA